MLAKSRSRGGRAPASLFGCWRGLLSVPSGTIRGVLDMYLDAISREWAGPLPPAGRALVQVLVTATIVTLLANILRSVGFRLALRVPSVAQSSFKRDARAEVTPVG